VSAAGTGPRRGALEAPLAGVPETDEEKAVLGAITGGADTNEALASAVGAETATKGLTLLQKRGRITGRGERGPGRYRVVPRGDEG